jgi:hypothetical protein
MRSVAGIGTLVLLLVFGVAANAQVVMSEIFNYPEGALCDDSTYINTTSPFYPLSANNVSGGLWVNGSTSKNDDPLLVQASALTYPGYVLSGLGKKVWCPNLTSNTSNNRAARVFDTQTGKVYFSVMVNLPTLTDLSASTSSGGEYLFGLYTAAGFATANGRGLVTFKQSATAGKFIMGVRANSTATAGWVSKDLDTLTTHLVVVAYDRTTATAEIWVNPSLTGIAPTPDATSYLGGADAATDLGRFGIYQRGSKPHAYVGGIRVGTAWVAITNIASVPMTETFAYPLGALCDVSATLNTTSPYYPVAANDVSSGIWINGSTSKNDDPLLVQSGALTYAGYALSGLGNKVWCPNLVGNTSNNRASRAFDVQTGKVYFAALVNLPTLTDLSASTSSGGEYLMGLYTSAGFATANGRGLVTFKQSATAGKFIMGIRANSTATAGWVSKDLDTLTTHLVVAAYDRSTATAQIWVNPSITGTEPTADATSYLGGADAATDLGRFGIYQRGTKPHAYVGGITVAAAWPLSAPNSVSEKTTTAPAEFRLVGNYPNPFNPTTRIAFTVAKNAHASLIVFNLLGQEVATLFDQEAMTGREYEVTFSGASLSSGMYLVRLTSDGATSVHKMLLMK